MKKIVLTGGTRGIGFETAKAILLKGGYHVTITGRTQESVDNAVNKIKEERGDVAICGFPLDLTSFASVREFVGLYEEDEIDVLMHNAGLMPNTVTEKTITEDGFETIMQCNVFGLMYLNQLLLPKLAADGRVFIQGSRMHMTGNRGLEVNFQWDNVNGEQFYDAQMFYKNSKLAVIWYAFELNRRLKEPQKVIVGTPGFVPETIAETYSGWKRFMFNYILYYLPMAKSIHQAVENTIYAALEYEGDGGVFIGDREVISASPDAENVAKQKDFFEKATKLVEKCFSGS